MIIVINKKTLDCQPYSSLTGAFENHNFEKTLFTLQKEKFPIILKEYVIHKKEVIKTKYKKTNFVSQKEHVEGALRKIAETMGMTYEEMIKYYEKNNNE